MLVLLACYLGARFGLEIPKLDSRVSLIWPPAGIALAAMLRWGLSMWPGVAFAAALAALGAGGSPTLALGMAAGSTIAPLAAAWALRRAGLRPSLERSIDVWLYCLVGGLACTLGTASSGALWVGAVDAPAPLSSDWLQWWLRDAAGVMLIGIPLLTLTRSALHRAFSEWHWLPNLLLVSATIAAGVLAFAPAAGLSPFLFVPHVLLCWLTLRGGVFVASSTALLLAAGAAVAT
ncbi:MAG TPA: MASE1 domain-containing protein, partial [Albitalea sp.]|nr:MASE1 domain-containing protein [Albitalea sp.]